MAATTTTKTATKAKVAAKPKAAAATASHPTFQEMIKECIALHKEERGGVSRPQIKKYILDKYKLADSTTNNNLISKAIKNGAAKSVFNLPKGSSGKVKLMSAPKKVSTSNKENKPAAAKKTTAAKPAAKAPAKKAPAAKPKALAAKKAPVKKTVPAKVASAKKASAPKKAAPAKAKAAAKPKAAAAKPKSAPKKA